MRLGGVEGMSWGEGVMLGYGRSDEDLRWLYILAYARLQMKE